MAAAIGAAALGAGPFWAGNQLSKHDSTSTQIVSTTVTGSHGQWAPARAEPRSPDILDQAVAEAR